MALAQDDVNYCNEGDAALDSARKFHNGSNPAVWNIDSFIQATRDYRECLDRAATVDERRYALRRSFDAGFYLAEVELHRSYAAKLIASGSLDKARRWFNMYHQQALSVLHSIKEYLSFLKQDGDDTTDKWIANRAESLRALTVEIEGISFDGLPDTFAQFSNSRFSHYLAADIGGTPTATPSPTPTQDTVVAASIANEQTDAMNVIRTAPSAAQLLSSVSVSAGPAGETVFAWTMTSGALYTSGTEEEKERFLSTLSQLTRKLYLKYHSSVNGISVKVLDENGNELASDEISE